LAKLEVRNVTRHFNAIPSKTVTDTNLTNVIENIDLLIEEGQFVCIVGPTGCGKLHFSTLWQD
jgi:ABC-type sugar transport system ATPase subunit